ncbi:MAG TPA: hypothetical protein VFO85_08770 [Vicinamibacteria bacterium]|nr:hypothetical protein [Vicinamibacteria bacterium]
METTYRPISKRRLKELRGYVGWVAPAFRALLFAAAVAAVAFLLRALLRRLAGPDLHPLWWMVPAAAFGAGLHRLAGRWTGGRAFRQGVRKDLAGGVAAVHRIRAVDAVEVEEGEDEGPTYFLLTDDGRTMVFSGQYLARYRSKGFPWREFEVLEAPHSKLFFGLNGLGERLPPSLRRPPLSWEEYKRLVSGTKEYGVLDVSFDTLKR